MPHANETVALKPRAPWVAALLSLICPGIGQVYATRNVRGFWFLGISAALYAVSTLLLSLPPNVGLGIILVIFIAVALLWLLYAVIDAARCAKRAGAVVPTGLNRWWVYVGLAVAINLWSLGVESATGGKAWQTYSIPSGSMEPNFRTKEYFVAWLNPFQKIEPKSGDVVVFLTPKNISYVKRIIGLPGDRVRLGDGHLYINGKQVAHTPLNAPDFPLNQGEVAFLETLPNGQEFAVIQNREGGPASNTPEYRVPAGHYFVLGDNRDNSADSRFTEMGYVPREKLLAYPVFIGWSPNWSRIGQLLR